MRKLLNMKAIKRPLATLSIASALSAGALGCGGQDPLTLFSDATVIPSLGLPFGLSLEFGGGATVEAYQPSNNIYGFRFQLNTISWGGIGNQLPLLAPEAGIISDISGDQDNGYTITIFHNARISTRISPAQFISREMGRQVFAGEQIGTVKNDGSFASAKLTFSVLLDGQYVCPASFLNASAIQKMFNVWSITGSSNSNLCQN